MILFKNENRRLKRRKHLKENEFLLLWKIVCD